MGQSPERRTRQLTTNARDRYESSHWGHQSKRVFTKNEPFDSPLTVMGALREFELDGTGFIPFDGHMNERDQYSGSLLAFSPRADERLYPILSRADKVKARNTLIDDDDDWVWLSDAAAQVGGRQCEFTYPRVHVQVIGVLTNVVYVTRKGDDDDPDGGFADFTHMLGEDTGVQPLLTIDETGRLWIAGGNYFVHDDGIED